MLWISAFLRQAGAPSARPGAPGCRRPPPWGCSPPGRTERPGFPSGEAWLAARLCGRASACLSCPLPVAGRGAPQRRRSPLPRASLQVVDSPAVNVCSSNRTNECIVYSSRLRGPERRGWDCPWQNGEFSTAGPGLHQPPLWRSFLSLAGRPPLPHDMLPCWDELEFPGSSQLGPLPTKHTHLVPESSIPLPTEWS